MDSTGKNLFRFRRNEISAIPDSDENNLINPKPKSAKLVRKNFIFSLKVQKIP